MLFADDPCRSIKCALFCEAECGWSRPHQRCETGLTTEPSEIEQRLGDCPGPTTTIAADAAPTTTIAADAAAASGGSDSGNDTVVVVVLIVAALLVVALGGVAAYFYKKSRPAEAGTGTYAAPPRHGNFRDAPIVTNNAMYSHGDSTAT